MTAAVVEKSTKTTETKRRGNRRFADACWFVRRRVQQRDSALGQQYQPNSAKSGGRTGSGGIREGGRLRSVRGGSTSVFQQRPSASDDQPPFASWLASARGSRPPLDAAAIGYRNHRRGFRSATSALVEPGSSGGGGRCCLCIRRRNRRSRSTRGRHHAWILAR